MNQEQWLNGWEVQPDSTIDRRALAVAFFKYPERWNKAFEFLKSNELDTLAAGRHDIDDDNLFASVSEYTTQCPAESIMKRIERTSISTCDQRRRADWHCPGHRYHGNLSGL